MIRTLSRSIAACLVTLPAPLAGAQEPIFTAQGSGQGAGLGRMMDRVGDVDGDGIGDFVCGGLGIVSVHSGIDGAELFQTTGAGSYYGADVAGLGDVDGDGIDDYAIGDLGTATVWVHSGRNGREIHQIQHGGPERMGAAVAAAEDWNQDGCADFLVGFPGKAYHQGDSSVPGFVRLLSGKDASTLLEIQPGNDFAWFGNAVKSVGDTDGDGVSDIAVGAYKNQKAWLFSGADGARIHKWKAADPATSWYGWELAAPGDVDKDSVPDIVVSDPGWELTQSNGEFFVYSGATGDEIYRGEGPFLGSAMGYSVSAAGDVDGDGAPDWMVGVNGKANTRGSARLYSGNGGGLLYEFVPESPDGDPWLGSSVAEGVDIDGDGRPDPRVGAVNEDGSLPDMGAVRAYASNDLFLNATPKRVLAGSDLTLRLGRASPGALSILFLRSIDGVACDCPLFGIAPLGADGFRELQISVDPAFQGMTFELQGYVLDGSLRDSAVETVVVE